MYEQRTEPLRVAVLAGGVSAERKVSLASGRAVSRAIFAAGHLIEVVDPADRDLADVQWFDFDVCFIALHGGAGEDGQVQRLLESAGIPYTGSGPAASQLAMSKSAAKERFMAAGVPTAEFVVFDYGDGSKRGRLGYEGHMPGRSGDEEVGFPLVIKPDRQGSSIGVTFAGNEMELQAGVDKARRFDSRIVAERWIDGREFTVALLGRRSLPLLEIVTPRALFDYEAKYESALTEHRFDHGLSGSAAERLTAVAVAAAEALGTTGLVRVDLMLDRAGQPWVLEVNTVPGMTCHSLAPRAAAQAGMSIVELCGWMIEDALLTEARR